MLAVCFHGQTRYSDVAKLIQSWSKTFHEERWGDIVHFLETARPVLLTMRTTWNERNYTEGILASEAGAQQAQQQQSDTRVDARAKGAFNVSVLTAILKNNKWFAYLDMVIAFHRIPTIVSNWAESCSCHGQRGKNMAVSVAGGGAPASAMALPQSKFGVKSSSETGSVVFKACPLKSCRLPELAAGTLQEVVSHQLDETIRQMMETTKHFLKPDEWSVLISDSESARAHLLFILQVKTDCASRLPRKAAGMSHADEKVAKTCARSCKAEYDAMSSALREPSSSLRAKLGANGPLQL